MKAIKLEVAFASATKPVAQMFYDPFGRKVNIIKLYTFIIMIS